MLIRKDGIYRNVPANEFGIWQQAGFEKVIKSEPTKVVEPEPVVKEIEVAEEKPVIDELPKSKKKKK